MAIRHSGALTDNLSFVEFETSEGVEVLSTFDSMNLKEDLVRGIYSYGKLRDLRLLLRTFDGISLPMYLQFTVNPYCDLQSSKTFALL